MSYLADLVTEKGGEIANAEYREIKSLLREVIDYHEPMEGEAYPYDPDFYCSVCVHPNGQWEGRHYKYPCPTVKKVKKALDNV